MRQIPFWKEDFTEALMSGVFKPLDVIEPFAVLDPEELEQRQSNFLSSATDGRFLTIYKSIPQKYINNFEATKNKVFDIEKDLGLHFIISSFFRSLTHHLRVYEGKGITDPSKIPMKSTHLICCGIDLVPIGISIKELHALFTEEFLEKHNLWMEHESHTPGWVHIQIIPYASWKPGKSRKYHI